MCGEISAVCQFFICDVTHALKIHVILVYFLDIKNSTGGASGAFPLI
jgi:hypothetical protein